MRAVWKFPLGWTAAEEVVSLPFGAMVRQVHEQDERPMMWVEVDTAEHHRTDRRFRVFATGEPIPDRFTRYLGTVHIGWTVWHIYEAP